MANPAPANFNNGVGAVSGDNLNTFVQTAVNLAQLRSFTALTNMAALVLGATAPNDGGQAFYYYTSSGSYVDNGTTVIVPYGALAGAWLKLTGV